MNQATRYRTAFKTKNSRIASYIKTTRHLIVKLECTRKVVDLDLDLGQTIEEICNWANARPSDIEKISQILEYLEQGSYLREIELLSRVWNLLPQEWELEEEPAFVIRIEVPMCVIKIASREGLTIIARSDEEAASSFNSTIDDDCTGLVTLLELVLQAR